MGDNPPIGRLTNWYNSPPVPTILPVDPLFADVVLLLPLNTVSGLTDVKSGIAVTNNGTTSSAFTDPFGSTTGVRSFNGSSWLSVAANSLFSFGNGAHAIEGWFYFTSFPTAQWAIVDFRPADYGGSDKNLLTGNIDNNTGVGRLGYYDGGYAYTASAVALNTWLYICVSRQSTGFSTLHVNGSLVATNTTRNTTLTSSNPFLIGARNDTTFGYNGRMAGYASNIRITRAHRNGSVVPTAPFPTS